MGSVEATRAVSSLLWGGADHEGIGWRAAARWLGVLGWLGMLMVLVVQFPPPQRQPDPRHIGGLPVSAWPLPLSV